MNEHMLDDIDASPDNVQELGGFRVGYRVGIKGVSGEYIIEKFNPVTNEAYLVVSMSDEEPTKADIQDLIKLE